MASSLREAAQAALQADARPEEAITVNQRALIDKILARYSAEFTVFRELLQNADDAGATDCELRFATSATVAHAQAPPPAAASAVPDVAAPLTQWTFRNNGKPFSGDDWHRLRRIAEGNPDPERIGAFGVGFYSLFSICEEPIVLSGDELLGFFWKGDALYTQRAQAPQTDVSETGMPWTTFLMALREPTPFPESPLALCQFLATSLTFTAGVRRIALYLDDRLLCRLTKDVGAPQPVAPSRHLSGVSPKRMLRVQALHSTALQIHVEAARLVLLEAAAQAEREKPSLKNTLFSALSKSAGAGLSSMLSSALGGLGAPAKPAPAAPAAGLDAEAQLALVPAALHLHVLSATAGVSVDAAFAREIARSTKKPLPRTTPLQLVFMREDELAASRTPPPPSAHTELDVHVQRLFAGLMPALDAQGRVFIGFRTHQTTSFAGHMAARFIPTVERESLDFVDRYCARWNTELLAVAGYVARAAYEAEMQRLGAAWAGAEEAARAALLDAALHTMRFFSFYASSPSTRVSATIEEAFFACCTRPCISLASTRGVHNSDRVRFPNALLGEFVRELPTLPAAHIERAEAFVLQLKARNLVHEITLDDVFAELGARALSVDEMVACLRWWLAVAEHPSYDARLLTRLVGSAVTGAPRVQALSDVRTVLQPAKVPAHVALPPTCLVPEVSRAFRPSDLTAVFGWAELSVHAWLEYVLALDRSPAPEVRAAQGVTHAPENAERVLQTLAWAWGNLAGREREAIAATLADVACVPTRHGLRRPNDAYFASVSLFSDLPVVAFPTAPVKGNLEKLLAALGVRHHVEIQLILDRLLAAGDWSHVDLIAYLAKHRERLSAGEMQRLAHTPLFPLEGDAGARRVRAAELYEPRDELRALALPILAWPGRVWRASSDDAKLVVALGLRRDPPLEELLRRASDADAPHAAALQYLLTHFSGVYAERYTRRAADRFAFVPTRGGARVPPAEAYTDAGVATMGFAVAALAPLDALKLQLPAHPDGAALVARLLAAPPADEDAARRVFVFLASCRDLRAEELRALHTAPVVPVRRGAARALAHAAPRDCYFWPAAGAAPAYRDVFDYVDYGPTAAVFLRAVGVSDEPSVEELVAKLVADAPRFYALCGGTEAYLGVLRRVAEQLAALSDDALWALKRAPHAAADDEADAQHEYALRRPCDVVIVDDAHAHMLFGTHVFAAPPDDALETQLYAPLGAPRLSTLVDERYAIAHDVRADTPRARTVHATILERTPLFLFEKRASARKEIAREFEWLRDALHVVEVGGRGVELTRTLRYRDTEARDVQRCSAMAVLQRERLVLHLAADLDVDWFEVALALNKFLLTKQHLQEVLLFMTVLSTPLRSLKRKGFHVDKMLAQQRPAPDAPIRAEPPPPPPDLDALTAEVLQMFPEAEPTYVAELLRSFASEHVERASDVLLRGEYPRRPGVQAPGGLAPGGGAPGGMDAAPPGALTGPPPGALEGPPPGTLEGPKGAPPGSLESLKGPSPATKPEGGAPAPLPPLDVGALQGASGGLFQHWKKRFTGTKLSSLASGSSSIQRPGQAPPPPPPPAAVRDDAAITPTANIRQHVQRAIEASRPEGARVIQSQAEQREVRRAATSYCDVSGIHTDLRLAGQVAGMNVYTSVELDPAKTLQHNGEALQRLIELVYRPVGRLFQLDLRCLNVFCDTKGPSIAFNRGGSLFLNLRYYLAWHDDDVRAGRLAAPLVSVYFSVAHELAHNLVADHNSEHEFYFSSIAEQHLLGLAQTLAQLRP
ncbi:hypothetical protein MOBT1_003308 [Malassezia obtusa]|uniref:Sacsin/Nov domain-containing protein n=1 Tax=Malassezia obtusa TaxID=76774 RepID=A0AAF0ITC1_9BASI|nr:hypothetical protein MOBT1_003308 [Malassezia obtusa]